MVHLYCILPALMHGAFILHAICTVGSGRCGSSSTADVLPSLPPLLGKCTYLVFQRLLHQTPQQCCAALAWQAGPICKPSCSRRKMDMSFNFCKQCFGHHPLTPPHFRFKREQCHLNTSCHMHCRGMCVNHSSPLTQTTPSRAAPHSHLTTTTTDSRRVGQVWIALTLQWQTFATQATTGLTTRNPVGH